jgi:ATP-dependent RNA circularization protein (DNA/RNA ligase family)
MTDFFRFPHMPHLAWLGEGSPRDDKLLDSHEADQLLSGEVVVEEKLDGANLGVSLGPGGTLRVQNRGQYLQAPFRGQFSRLSSWLNSHHDTLSAHLGPDRILFGEWCAARHSIQYTSLPDWFLVFDVYDRKAGRFWSTRRRNELAAQSGLAGVPALLHEKTTLTQLKQLLSQQASTFSPGPLEGIVIRREDHDWLLARAKLVHPGFTQAIDEHWSRRGIEWNQIANSISEQRPTIPRFTP